MIKEQLTLLIENTFDNAEVREVAIYVLSRLTLSELAIQALMTGQTEVRNIPPEALSITLRYDANMTNNSFYGEFFKPIRTQVALDEAKLNTQRINLQRGITNNDKDALFIAKSLLINRFDSLSTIAFLYKGSEFQNEFDIKMRDMLKLTDEHKAFFSRYGV